MSTRIGGIHHVTCMAGDPQANVDFYAGVLGMRLVKRSVNQDEPGTYHLFYADAVGHPGTDLTFFPWPGGAEGQNGAGMTNEVSLAVPPESGDFWRDRLQAHGVEPREERRFGERTLVFRDPHGLHVALAESPHAAARRFAPWENSPISEAYQVRGLHAVRLVERDAAPTRELLTRVMGIRHVGADGGWDRFEGSDPTSGTLELRADADAPRPFGGVGTVHHVAWRVKDDAEEERMQAAVRAAGISTTPVIDRFWFRSVYFREPGGALFELATDGPGFGIDEPIQTLGEQLLLPPWLEEHRTAIEAGLPPLELPHHKEKRPKAIDTEARR